MTSIDMRMRPRLLVGALLVFLLAAGSWVACGSGESVGSLSGGTTGEATDVGGTGGTTGTAASTDAQVGASSGAQGGSGASGETGSGGAENEVETVYDRGVALVTPLEADGEYLYWAESNRGVASVLVGPRDGSAEPRTLAPWVSEPTDDFFVVDETHLYWHELGVLKKVSKSNWSVEEIPFGSATPRMARVLDATHVYVADLFCEGVWRVQKSGTGEALFIELLPALIGDRGGVTGLALDETHIYCGRGQRVLKVSKEGGEVEELVTGQTDVGPIYVYGDYVYWINNNPTDDLQQFLARASKSGDGPREILLELGKDAGRLLFDEERREFFMMPGKGYGTTSILGYGPDADGARTVATEVTRYGGTAQDDDYFYWVSRVRLDDGTGERHDESKIMRVRK